MEQTVKEERFIKVTFNDEESESSLELHLVSANDMLNACANIIMRVHEDISDKVSLEDFLEYVKNTVLKGAKAQESKGE